MTRDVAEVQKPSEPEGARPGQQSCDGRAPILTTHGLTKQFGSLRAVDGLDMQVCKGDVFGFLGPNGAGKTTVHPARPGPHPSDERARGGVRPPRAR